jgi:Cu2+-exporting ATPase
MIRGELSLWQRSQRRYNLLAIPPAVGVLAWAGFVLPMAVGAILMSSSTMIVAINAQFLRRIDLRPAAI